ncbi:S46 family peptidase [Rheinheimera oceanensis]|uniref:S46 family peptidase n=1 Tax=Rheinheimera oceanensis TaxID=2817449 RepID=UPI001BFD824F|nr:S46 family peptidase [Rheinheimera oceanensis]
MRKIYRYIAVLLTLCCSAAAADEGLWQPQQLPELKQRLVAQGLLTAQQQADAFSALPLNALVRLNNCSAAFVSKSGLLLTNYACVADSLQQVGFSTPQQEFSAANAADEIPLPGIRALLIRQIQNVTVQLNRQLDTNASPAERAIALQQLSQKIIVECQQRSDYICEVTSQHDGLEYYLVKSEPIAELRLVHLPLAAVSPEQAPNWGWPRYQADYVFLRAYTAGNTAFKPAAHLTLSAKGITEGDTVMAAAFPQQSSRYASADEVRFLFEQYYPQSVQYRQQALALITQLAPSGSARARQYQDLVRSLQQSLIEEQNMIARYQQSSLQQKKDMASQQLNAWIAGSPVRQQLYQPRLERLKQLSAQQQIMAQRDLVLTYLSRAQLPTLARRLYRVALAKQQAKDSTEQQQVASEVAQLQQLISEMPEQFDVRVDLELALHFLRQYASLPPAARIGALDHYFALGDGFNQEIVRHKLETMYRGTSLRDAEQRSLWLERSAKQFEKSRDTLLGFAVAMHSVGTELEQQRFELASQLAQIRPLVMEIHMAYAEANGELAYADANGTLRLSFGTVKGYQPVDAVWYQPFSTVQGMAVQPQASALATTDTSLQVNFLSTIDTCGRGSSAPTFNTQGQLVGLMFSGVAENQLANWHYDARRSRAVHLDIRYLLWQLRQSSASRHLLDEMAVSF